MTIAELLAATGLTANDLVPIYDAEAAQNVEPTQKITAAQFAAAVKVLASLVNTTEMNAAIQQSTALYCEHISCTPAQSISAGAYGYYTVPVSYAKGKNIVATRMGIGHPGMAGGYIVMGDYTPTLNVIYVSYYSPRALTASNADFTVDIIYTDKAITTNSHTETV